MLDSLKFSRSVIETHPLKDIVISEVLPGNNIKSDDDIKNYCRRTVKTNWHPVGTCKMGSDKDVYAVLNSKLQVMGIDNLRVFDVSMLPNLISGNTNAPAMAIADKATDMMIQ